MKVIGRSDKADFPELKISNIGVKIDTGAFTSTIHSHDIKEVESNDEKYVEFKLLDPSHLKYRDRTFKTKNYKVKTIKSSFGDIEQRFVISSVIVIFDKEYPIELSLSERSDMKFPILLGRKFLNNQFLVNTSSKNLSFKLKQGKKRN